MAIATTAMKNNLADAYAGAADFGALYSTAPGATAGTELSGGSPAYARKALTWPAAANGTTTAAAVVFDVPAGATVAGFGFHSAVTGGTYLDGVAVTSQPFSSQGTFQIVATYTQS